MKFKFLLLLERLNIFHGHRRVRKKSQGWRGLTKSFAALAWRKSVQPHPKTAILLVFLGMGHSWSKSDQNWISKNSAWFNSNCLTLLTPELCFLLNKDSKQFWKFDKTRKKSGRRGTWNRSTWNPLFCLRQSFKAFCALIGDFWVHFYFPQNHLTWIQFWTT